MRRRSIVAAALVLTGTLAAQSAIAAGQIRFETDHEGELITITASADMEVEARTVWAVISDYDNLADFIPHMRSSRVLRRDGDQVLIEQTGEFGFLFFRRPVEVRLSVAESPPRRIVAHAVGGNLQSLEGRYAIESLPGGEVRLNYSGRLVPGFDVPRFVSRMAVRSTMARQFQALVQEIVRRDLSARNEAR
ncbi:MAG TPA: SRPBCC family protein [Variovorax sp.]|nr:SRPBCC family protein [Variovorax sp.]